MVERRDVIAGHRDIGAGAKSRPLCLKSFPTHGVALANGLLGLQLPYFWSFLNESAWMGFANRRIPHQFLGYYLQGAVPLSYQIDDPNLTALRKKFLGYILGHQNISSDGAGWIGPPSTHTDPHDYWSQYDIVQALEFFAEAEPSAAASVHAALLAHHRAVYRAMLSDSPKFNASRWGIDRYSDGIVGIEWCIDRGLADSSDGTFLWDLLRLLRSRADQIMSAVDHSWEDWFRLPPKPVAEGGLQNDPFGFSKSPASEPTGIVHLLRHGVDIGQAMKTGPLWWRADGLDDDLNNSAAALRWADAYLGRADGM